ncbi:hypothetical protein [Rhizobium leguminosarum]
MEVKFLSGNGVERAIEGLIAEHDEFHWPVAWGTSTSTSLAQNLLSQSAKSWP